MPQLAAASSRDRPSKTSAIASIRRAALASRVRAASRRKSPADRSRRVIATAMSASAPGQWRSESRRPPKRGHVRVIGQGAWYHISGHHLPGGVDVGTFWVIGYIPYYLLRGVLNRGPTAIAANQSLLYHRHITLLDIMLARDLLEGGATAGALL